MSTWSMTGRRLTRLAWDMVGRRLLRAPKDVPVFLGSTLQRFSLFAPVRTGALWRDEPLSRKLLAVARMQWAPSESALQAAARESFLDEVFGRECDFGPQLLRLMRWHHSRSLDFSALSPGDDERAVALESFTVLARIRLGSFRSTPPLNLCFGERAPGLATLAFPMVVKIPVVSFQHFLEVHTAFAFNTIRAAGHPAADDLIAYLYEVLFLQQKIAIALHEYVRMIAFVQESKGASALINAEVTAILSADLVFSYLKASLEKTIALTGLTYGIANLDGKKTHKAKLAALRAVIPPGSAATPYGSFLLEYIKSENLEGLNSYRSGLLHKKGIADLQPHNFVAGGVTSASFMRMFSVLHEQHALNTAVLLCALALLTDDLVSRDPPALSQDELMASIDAMADL